MHEGASSNGTITIGGVDTRLSDGPVQYVDDVGFGFHSVKVESILVGGNATTGAAGAEVAAATVPVGSSAILDTGTNVLLLNSDVRAKVQQAICADAALPHCAAFFQNECFPLTAAELASYPNVALQLDNGVALEMTSRDYLLLGSPFAKTAGQYCNGIRDGGSAGGSGFIIGDTTMRNYYLVFDLANTRIGWGKVNKGKCGSV
jgi:hypothetical protein